VLTLSTKIYFLLIIFLSPIAIAKSQCLDITVTVDEFDDNGKPWDSFFFTKPDLKICFQEDTKETCLAKGDNMNKAYCENSHTCTISNIHFNSDSVIIKIFDVDLVFDNLIDTEEITPGENYDTGDARLEFKHVSCD
jgi:hypothetical protein